MLGSFLCTALASAADVRLAPQASHVWALAALSSVHPWTSGAVLCKINWGLMMTENGDLCNEILMVIYGI